MAEDEKNQEGMTPEEKRFQHRMRREQLAREGGVGKHKVKQYGQQLGAGVERGDVEMNYPENAIERRRRWKRDHKMWHDVIEEQRRLRREHGLPDWPEEP